MTSARRRDPLATVVRAVPPLLVATLLAGGCAGLEKPRWPWSKPVDDLTADDAGVISSERAGADTGTGWDFFKGENIKKRWKKLVGRGPNEAVARAALAEGDALYRERRYYDAITKYKVAIDRWPDSTVEEDALWQLAECWFFTDRYPKAEDGYDELVKKYANSRYLDRVAQRPRHGGGPVRPAERVERALAAVGHRELDDLVAGGAQRTGDGVGRGARVERPSELVGCHHDAHRCSVGVDRGAAVVGADRRVER